MDPSSPPPQLYTYNRIPSTHIRILVLSPAPDLTSPLRASLETHAAVCLDTKLPIPLTYDAVSYFWGTAKPSVDMVCDEKALRVTPTVNNMLRYLRKGTKERRLWVDAICINQGDGEEKSEQVRGMAYIYSCARKVRIWLGEASEEDGVGLAFEFLKRLPKVAQDSFSKNEYDSRVKNTMNWIDEDGAKEVGKLLSRPWFQRRWVLQEYVLATTLIVQCGMHVMQGEWFKQAIKLMKQPTSRPDGRSRFPKAAQYTLDVFRNITAHRKDMLDLLYTCNKSKCVDERDRLFALNGLVHDKGKVNYRKSWVEIYTSFARRNVVTIDY
ncbi:HET-domain-containing protein, partial [Lophiostoma macrostomum CBS 122681]